MVAQVEIVAGGGGELGRATAMALAAGGRSVVAVDRNERGLLTSPAASAARWPRPPTPLWRESSSTGGDALSTTPETLRLMFDVNRDGAVAEPGGSAAHAPGLRGHRGRGRRPGLEPAEGMAAYREQGRPGAPDAHPRHRARRARSPGERGLLDTTANRAALPAEVMAKAVSPEAIADVIAFRVSDAAAPGSGAILPVYGG